MAENLSNNAQTILYLAVRPTDTTITVHDVTGFPSPNFRILIDSELMLVTAATSNVWTVTRGVEGTVAGSHTTNATVSQVLTVAGLTAFVGGIGVGTVTSVGLSLPATFSVSGSPVTSSGTISATYVNQAANSVLAGPTSGGNATPAFRSLVAADIPAIAESGVTGLVSDLAGKVATTRNVSTTAPLTGGGALSADLTLAISAATDSTAGSLSAADKTKLDGSTNSNTASTLVQRGTMGEIATGTITTALVTGLSAPSGSTDAANKNYVDISVQGLTVKPTADLATTAALPSNTYSNGSSGVGATLTATGNGALSVDSQAVTSGQLILVKNEATAARNGLYTVTQTGGVSATYVLTRSIDMQTAGEFSGAFLPVGSLGTVNANTLWLANPSGTVTVGTTSIPFTQLNGATDLIAGTGIGITGNTISVTSIAESAVTGLTSDLAAKSPLAGSSSIVTTGTITSGTWNGTAIAAAYVGNLPASQITSGTLAIAQGGTNAATANAAFNNLAPSQSSNSGKYLTTDGANTSWSTVTGGVTSVGLSMPSTFSVSGSPITSSGTISVSYTGLGEAAMPLLFSIFG